jgi:predicted nucleic acid-binding protein
MSLRLADAALFIAVLNRRDRFHSWSRDYYGWTHDRLVVPLPVLVEVGNYFSGSASRGQVISFLRCVERDTRVDCVALDGDLMRETMDLYAARRDKEWGLTDGISFVVMRRAGIEEAVTTDHHFEQAGFTILMKP